MILTDWPPQESTPRGLSYPSNLPSTAPALSRHAVFRPDNSAGSKQYAVSTRLAPSVVREEQMMAKRNSELENLDKIFATKTISRSGVTHTRFRSLSCPRLGESCNTNPPIARLAITQRGRTPLHSLIVPQTLSLWAARSTGTTRRASSDSIRFSSCQCALFKENVLPLSVLIEYTLSIILCILRSRHALLR